MDLACDLSQGWTKVIRDPSPTPVRDRDPHAKVLRQDRLNLNNGLDVNVR